MPFEFRASPRPTLGVEEEYQICDPESGDLAPAVDRILELATSPLREHLGYDLILTLIEANTAVAETVDEAVEDIVAKRRQIQHLAERIGCTLGLTGTHAYADPKEQGFVDTPDYHWVAEQLRYVAQRNITFGLHVHVGVDDADRAIYVTNSMRRWIGPLVALAGNSPFLDGVDTGWSSSRMFAFGTFPRAGLPPRLGSWQEYSNQMDGLIAAEAITKPRQIWWNVRAHPEYGTVETRVFDVQISVPRTAALVALTQALVVQHAEDHRAGEPEVELPGAYLEDCRFKAMRFGLDTRVIDPATAEVSSMRDFVGRMLEFARPAAERLGTTRHLEAVGEILDHGNGATFQRALLAERGGDLRAVQKRLLELAREEGIRNPPGRA